MHLGVRPDNLLERAVLLSGVAPEQLMTTFWGMGTARTAIAAARLGIFEALADGPASSEQIAERLELTTQGTQALLAALNGFGFVEHRQGQYRNSKQTRRWLLRDSRFSVRDSLEFFGDLWDRLEGLEELVRTGEIPRLHDTNRDDGFWRRYMRALGSPAKILGREVVRKVKLASPPKRLLDVGGGHGMFSVAFCRKYPELHAEVLDLAPACVHGREMVQEEGFTDRVTYREGDFRCESWGSGYDLVFLFNVIHNATPTESERMVADAYAALAPGGKLVILDGEHRQARRDTSAMAGWNQLFFFILSGAQTYPEELIRGWVEAAGFVDLKRKRTLMMPEFVLIGTRPDGAE
jgi:SAM-dependent methyltransferase